MAKVMTHVTIGEHNLHWMRQYEWKRLRSITFEDICYRSVFLPKPDKHSTSLKLTVKRCILATLCNPFNRSVSELVLSYSSISEILPQCPNLRVLDVTCNAAELMLTIPNSCTTARFVHKSKWIQRPILTIDGKAQLEKLEIQGWDKSFIANPIDALTTLVLDTEHISFPSSNFPNVQTIHCPASFLKRFSFPNLEKLSIVSNEPCLDLTPFAALNDLCVEITKDLKICNSSLEQLCLIYPDNRKAISLTLSNVSVSRLEVQKAPFFESSDWFDYDWATEDPLVKLFALFQSTIRLENVQTISLDQFTNRCFYFEGDNALVCQANEAFGRFARKLVDFWTEKMQKSFVDMKRFYRYKEDNEKFCQVLQRIARYEKQCNLLSLCYSGVFNVQEMRNLQQTVHEIGEEFQKCFKQNTRYGRKIDDLQNQYDQYLIHLHQLVKVLNCCADNALVPTIRSMQTELDANLEQRNNFLQRAIALSQPMQQLFMKTDYLFSLLDKISRVENLCTSVGFSILEKEHKNKEEDEQDDEEEEENMDEEADIRQEYVEIPRIPISFVEWEKSHR